MAPSILAEVGLSETMVRELHEALVKPAEEITAIAWNFCMDGFLCLLGIDAHLWHSDCWKSSTVNLWNSNA